MKEWRILRCPEYRSFVTLHHLQNIPMTLSCLCAGNAFRRCASRIARRAPAMWMQPTAMSGGSTKRNASDASDASTPVRKGRIGPIWNSAKKKSTKCDLCADAPYWSQKGGPGGKQACVETCAAKALKLVSEAPSQSDVAGYDVNLAPPPKTFPKMAPKPAPKKKEHKYGKWICRKDTEDKSDDQRNQHDSTLPNMKSSAAVSE